MLNEFWNLRSVFIYSFAVFMFQKLNEAIDVNLSVSKLRAFSSKTIVAIARIFRTLYTNGSHD